jgi:arylsulfatase A-like enzyme
VFSDYHRHLVDNGFVPDSELEGLPMFTSDFRANLPEAFQMATFLGDRAAEYIDEQKDRPFVLFVSTFEPHSPYYGPLNDLYDPAELPTGPTFLKKPEGGSIYNRVRADFVMDAYENGGEVDPYLLTQIATFNDLTSEEGFRELRARYFANITLVDRMAKKILDAIEGAGIADDTAVVFTSEHGEMGGDHGMLEKRSFYDEASRVPMLLSAPWLNFRQQRIPGSMSHADLVPTLLDLLDQPVPDHLEGSSLLPVLTGEANLDEHEVVIEWNGISDIEDRNLGNADINLWNTQPWRSLVYRGWKLNLCATDQCELFDLENDPYEERNLFDDPDQRRRVRDMAARIRLWQHRTGDTVPMPTV